MTIGDLLEIDRLLEVLVKTHLSIEATLQLYRLIQDLRDELTPVEAVRAAIMQKHSKEMSEEESEPYASELETLMKQQVRMSPRRISTDIDLLKAGVPLVVVARLVALGVAEETRENSANATD